jgi:hypothetical protein
VLVHAGLRPSRREERQDERQGDGRDGTRHWTLMVPAISGWIRQM